MSRMNLWFGGVSLLCIGIMGLVSDYRSVSVPGLSVSDEMADEVRGGQKGCTFCNVSQTGCGLVVGCPTYPYVNTKPPYTKFLVYGDFACDEQNILCGESSVYVICTFGSSW